MSQQFEGQQDDRDLVNLFLRTRDETSFRTLYKCHTPKLFLLALRLMGGNQPDAEDAVQEAWIQAVRNLSSFRWESSLRTWLCGITIRCSRKLISHKRPAAPLDCEPTISNRTDFLNLEFWINRLPAGYREVLVLHDVEGYTHEEIGRLLDIQQGTSKSQLFHARRLIRNWLGFDPEKRAVGEKHGS
jgi:RNA polymerase sigma-70 factor, ECF subfamily